MDAALVADLELILNRVADPIWQARWNYYTGKHPRLYVNAKTREMFASLNDAMADNYCGLAVGSRVTRLRIEGWDGPGAEQADNVWETSRLPQRQDRLFRWALAYGECVLLLDDNDDDGVPKIRVNRPTQAAVIMSDEYADEVRVAGKVWKNGGDWHATLWYEDETVRLILPDSDRPDPQRFDLDPDDPGGLHGFDSVPAVPVLPYADGPVLIDTLHPAQDRVNKITSNKMVAGEFTAFAQRVFFTRQDVQPYDLRNAPDHAIVLDPGDADGKASVQQLPSGDLTGYIRDRNDEIDNLFTLGSLPRHMRVNPGAPPSGDAMRADEGPFVQAVEDNQRELGEALVSGLALLGVDADPIWKSVAVDDRGSNAQAFAQTTAAGLPWQMTVREYLGWTDEQVVEAETYLQGTTEPDALGAALLSLNANPTLPTE